MTTYFTMVMMRMKMKRWTEVIDHDATIDNYNSSYEDDERDGDNDDHKMKGRKRKGQGVRLSPFRSLCATLTTMVRIFAMTTTVVKVFATTTTIVIVLLQQQQFY